MAMSLDIGRLRHRITLRRPEWVRDPVSGARRQEMRPFAQRWATVEPLKGDERFQAMQVQAEVTHHIYMRYMPDIGPEMEIEFRGRLFDIVSIRNIEERNFALDILAKERVGGAGNHDGGQPDS